MITFFRRIFNSKLGLIGSFIFIALVAISFAGSDITGSMNGTGTALSSGTVAEVGKSDISTEELQMRAQNQLEVQRRDTPGLEMSRFINTGGFEETLEQMINVRALEGFAKKQGLGVSKRLVDGEIASIPAFNGPNGKFDRDTFLAILSQRRVSEKQLRDDIASDLLTRQMLVPASAVARLPAAMARPYAALSLEERSGLVGFVPSSAVASTEAPSEAELNAYYTRNISRYTIPERRVIRYAMFDKAMLADKAKPTEADFVAYYKNNAPSYAASETRVLTQVILQDQKAAQAFEAKVRGGTSFATAAAQAGLEATTFDQTKEAFAGLSSAAVADAVFKADKGTIVPPQRSGLGWHVVRVDSVKIIPARSLDAVRGEISEDLAKEKIDAAMADYAAKIEDMIANKATFDEIVKANGLKPVTTPAITSAGVDPENPNLRPDENFVRFLEPAFEMGVDDDPTIESIIDGERYALTDVERIIPASPPPLAQIKERVIGEFKLERASARAKALADAIVAKVSKGMSLPQAMNEAGVKLPAPERIGGKRAELSANGRPVAPPLTLLFSMAEKRAKHLEAPGKQGWFVVWLDKIVPGNIAAQPQLVEMLRRQMSGVLSQEYTSQFVNATKAELGVKRNGDAAAKLKRQLIGTETSFQ